MLNSYQRSGHLNPMMPYPHGVQEELMSARMSVYSREGELPRLGVCTARRRVGSTTRSPPPTRGLSGAGGDRDRAVGDLQIIDQAGGVGD